MLVSARLPHACAYVRPLARVSVRVCAPAVGVLVGLLGAVRVGARVCTAARVGVHARLSACASLRGPDRACPGKPARAGRARACSPAPLPEVGVARRSSAPPRLRAGVRRGRGVRAPGKAGTSGFPGRRRGAGEWGRGRGGGMGVQGGGGSWGAG